MSFTWQNFINRCLSFSLENVTTRVTGARCPSKSDVPVAIISWIDRFTFTRLFCFFPFSGVGEAGGLASGRADSAPDVAVAAIKTICSYFGKQRTSGQTYRFGSSLFVFFFTVWPLVFPHFALGALLIKSFPLPIRSHRDSFISPR